MIAPHMFQHRHPFDPSYGYDLSRLRAVGPPPPPPGFEAFWQATYDEARQTPPRPVLRQLSSPDAQTELFEIDYDGIGGFRVGGWLTRPANQRPRRGVIVGHGYGGRQMADLKVPGPAAVALFPCGRGFQRSARPDLPGRSLQHVVCGIDQPQTYLHRFCVADLWSAVSALTELAPEVAGCIDYLGVSFGGGIGAMSLPWEPRFRRAALGVPSFGNHPLRLTLPCVGSGEAVRKLYQHRPQILQTLAFFDAAVASTFTRIPVLVACALFDPAVPPPGQFCVYNALAGEKALFVRQADHFAWSGGPQENEKLFLAQDEWFSRPVARPATAS